MLETRQSAVTKPDTDLTELGYDNIDGLNLPVTSILSTQGNLNLLCYEKTECGIRTIESQIQSFWKWSLAIQTAFILMETYIIFSTIS